MKIYFRKSFEICVEYMKKALLKDILIIMNKYRNCIKELYEFETF